MTAATYVPTRFYSLSSAEDGTLVLHNSRTGALGAVPSHQAPAVRGALKRSARHPAPLDGILADLADGGVLVPEGFDERAAVHEQYLTKYRDDYLNLIILPTEDCNFRCVYCYESFERGAMADEIMSAIKKYVAAHTRLRFLDISWFGGEPLFAPNVVIELSRWFHDYSRERGIEYRASITTNGSLLSPDVAEEIIANGVQHFQITLDGEQADHDQRRVLNGGGGTFW